MGTKGQLSRIQNSFLSPVTHPALKTKAAPGQLSAKAIRTALALHGVIEAKNYHLFGTPISASRSPDLHNAFYKDHGLPHVYSLYETTTIKELEPILASPHFGGGSVTIPHKLSIRQYIDEESESARTIGAINTIVVDPMKPSQHGPGLYRIGHNTDWRGMVHVIEARLASNRLKGAGLVIGTGGTARAAIYALNQMGYRPILVLGRDSTKVKALTDSFPTYDVQDASSEPATQKPPRIAISTVPADKPLDKSVQQALSRLLTPTKPDDAPRVLLDMAYKPAVTELMKRAQDRGWEVIPGLDVLAAQGIYQFQLWTGILPLFEDAKDIVEGQKVEDFMCSMR